MKVVLLAAASSIHTLRWAKGLNSIDIEVHIISQHPLMGQIDKGIKVHILPFKGLVGYFAIVPKVKKLLSLIQPDLVNAHYASGYATTARLVGHRPWLLSVWGSDVYNFPYKSAFHKWIVKGNLYSADAVASTSHCMASQTRLIAPKLDKIAITPFGVDIEHFSKYSYAMNPVVDAPIVIGTVKGMSHVYGVDLLIKSFALVRERLVESDSAYAKRLNLRIVGAGPLSDDLKQLAKDKNIADVTSFIGKVDHNEVPVELAKLDVYVALSREESFGVAVIEAGAVGKPVVVSNVGGLPEVVLDGKTGFIVPPEDPLAASLVIEQLIRDHSLREKIGTAAQLHVSANYNWEVCLENMKNLYSQMIKDFNGVNK